MNYTTQERDRILINMPVEVKAEIKEWAEERGITLTAMTNIVLMYGMDVHRLLESQRNTAVSLALVGKYRPSGVRHPLGRAVHGTIHGR